MTEKKDTIEISKSTLTNGAIVVLAVLLIVSIFTGGFSGSGSSAIPTPTVERQGTVPTPTPAVDMKALVDDDPFKGDEDAPVTIVEFSDYECAFCARFYSQTLGQIEEKYINTGKVKLVYRDFPLAFHNNAQKAAEAAECAGDQDRYFDMHDLIFENGASGGVTAFKGYAQTLGLDTAAFNDCLDSGEKASEVKKDLADGQAAGVRGTPAFFVNGEMISGAQPFSVFETAIENALAN